MSEAWLLSMVFRYPHPKALLRKAQNKAVIAGLRSLERRGFVKRYRDHYRLTHRGRDELAMACAITRLVRRADSSPAPVGRRGPSQRRTTRGAAGPGRPNRNDSA